MELWQNGRKVAFTMKRDNGDPFAKLGDVVVMEETHIAGPPFRNTATFITEGDAKVYLNAKYPHAEKK